MAVSQEQRLSTAQAGWIGSAYMLGQLVAVLALPTLKFYRVVRLAACAAAVVLVGATLVSNSENKAILLGSWFVVGVVCGTLQFLATTTAAAAEDRRLAFAVRMAASSIMGAAVITVLQLVKGFAGYPALSHQLAVVFAVIAGAGLLLYRTPTAVSGDGGGARAASLPWSMPALAGFVVLFILFVGQHGLWAFALKGAEQRGLILGEVTWAIAACKFAGGAWVLGAAWRQRRNAERPSLLASSLAVALGGTCVALAMEVSLFWVGLLLWEIGINELSARVQAILALQDARRAGMWIASAIFLGAASGPALAGWATGAGLFPFYVAFGAASAIIPLLWTLALPRVAPLARA